MIGDLRCGPLGAKLVEFMGEAYPRISY